MEQVDGDGWRAEKPRPRCVRRVPLEAEVILRRSGENNYRVRVFDISTHGCRVEFVQRPQLDETVWVKFEGLEAMAASVCWTRGPLAGVAFTRPIYPAVFDLLLKRLDAPPA